MSQNINRFVLILSLLLFTAPLWAYPDGIALDTGLYQQTYCSAQLVIINNNLYSPSNPTGIEIIPNGAANGMDSVFRVELQFFEPVERDYVATLCQNDTIVINGSLYHTTHYEDTEVFENGAANGCDSIVNILLTFVPEPFFYLYDTLCVEDTLYIGDFSFFRDNPAGLARLPDASASGCDSLVYVSLYFNKAFVTLGEDILAFEGSKVCVQLESAQPTAEIFWTPDPAFCVDTECSKFCTDTLTEKLYFQVRIIDINGCTAEDDVKINIRRDNAVYGPNVFAPGTPEPNDRFFIQADPGVALITRLIVFDRWGETVFETSNIPNDPYAYLQGWDGTWRGKELPPDVFGWWAELKTNRGRTFSRSGSVTLLR